MSTEKIVLLTGGSSGIGRCAARRHLKSMMAVISLGVPTKAILSIQASGDDELAVIAEMKKAITSSDIGVILH